MATVFSLLRRLEALNPELVVYHSMQDCQQDLVDLNREQMYDGKNNKGQDITPSYFNDPYFKTRVQAQAYSDWKDEITPNPRRTKGTPNLFINGYYHSTIDVLIIGDKIVYSSRYDDKNDISETFHNIYGLGGEFRKIFLKQYFIPVFSVRIHQEIGLSLKAAA